MGLNLKDGLHNTSVRAGEFGGAFVDAFKPSTYKAAEGATKSAATVIESRGFASGLFNMAMTPFRLGFKLVQVPFALALKPVEGGLNMAAKSFKARPGVSLAVTAGVAAVGVGSWFAKRGSQNLQAQGEAIQQMQMAQIQPQPKQSFMGSVTPEESAMLAAMQKQGNGQGGSKAEAVMAARKPIDGPEMATANISAL